MKEVLANLIIASVFVLTTSCGQPVDETETFEADTETTTDESAIMSVDDAGHSDLTRTCCSEIKGYGVVFYEQECVFKEGISPPRISHCITTNTAYMKNGHCPSWSGC
jgi:hypothetical protein